MFYLYKLVVLFFDNKVSFNQLDQEDIYEVLFIYFLIKKYINNIHEKINSILGEDEELESSFFDDYDKENGYEDEEIEDYSIYKSSLKILNEIFELARIKFGNSLKASLDMDIDDLLDSIDYELNIKEQIKEDYTE